MSQPKPEQIEASEVERLIAWPSKANSTSPTNGASRRCCAPWCGCSTRCWRPASACRSSSACCSASPPRKRHASRLMIHPPDSPNDPPGAHPGDDADAQAGNAPPGDSDTKATTAAPSTRTPPASRTSHRHRGMVV
ncbi:hypothetical protein HC891_27955 [Candidatus Gracilibacteria bacterium]|nr:hypothetical protein [Candidatus Gracilibacteria bacterium]